MKTSRGISLLLVGFTGCAPAQATSAKIPADRPLRDATGKGDPCAAETPLTRAAKHDDIVALLDPKPTRKT